jgi:hypothetical protein
MKPPRRPSGTDTGLGSGPIVQLNTAPGWGLEIAGAVLSLVWGALMLGYVLISPAGIGTGVLEIGMTVLMALLPIALIWVVVGTLRSVRELRAEAARLQGMIDSLRANHAQSGGARPAAERRSDETPPAARQAEGGFATFSSRRDAGLSVPSADRKAALIKPQPEPAVEQPALALGTPAEDMQPPLAVGDFIRAVQFPESPEDKEGFRSLRLALENRTVAKLIRSAQDVLTLLSQDGIYMDDLKPDLCQPELWRRFSAGERGRSIAALGGIRDRNSLALTAARMKADPVFRDAAHHFLRTFDKTFAAFEPNASDAELADLSDTRTARAFMLFGRVTGTFD